MDKDKVLVEKGVIWFIVIVSIMGGILTGIFIGLHLEKGYWYRQAITHNCAQYDSQTGEFMWKEVGE